MTHSYPCGHTIRGCIVVYLVIALRRSWAAAAVVWFAAVQVSLVSTSGHTLTDLGGGLLLGLAIAAVMARALRHNPEPARVTAPIAPAAAGEDGHLGRRGPEEASSLLRPAGTTQR